MTTVTNSYGVQIDFTTAVYFMDDELREEIHNDLAPCTEQAFFDEYAKRYDIKYGEPWFMDSPNPQY